MRNVLKYYYNLQFDDIKEYDEYAILKKADKIYIFRKYIYSEEELVQINSFLNSASIPFHILIINNQNMTFTPYNNENYILLLVRSFDIVVNDRLFIPDIPKKEYNVSKIWSDKIDYYMRQVAELALGKELLINSFNYYIGMAENALSLYTRALKMSGDLHYSICHRRIFYPNFAINYYDPSNMLIDLRIRDISGFIKSKFFKVGMEVSEVISLTNKYNLNDKEINLMYARLFYPTYYFDIFEDGIVKDCEEKKLFSILTKRKEYEKFLYEVFFQIKKNHFIYEIEWIKKGTL